MYGIMIAIFILPAQNMYRRLSVSILPDNRSAAREWIYENIPAGTAIAVGTYHVPKLHDVEKLNQRIEVTLSCSRFIEEIKNYYSRFPVYQITKLGVDSDYNFDNLLEADVKYVLIADWNYMKMFPRDPSFIPQKGQPQYGQFIKRRNFYRKLLSEDSPFKLKKKFSSGSGPKIELLRLR